MTSLFELVGSIFVKNSDANSQIDNTTSKAKNMASVVGSAFQTAGDKITGIGKAIAPVSAVVGGALGASLKGASDFTDGMSKMSTLFDTTQTSVSDLSKEFLTLSNKTGIGASELAEAGYQALSAGQSVENVGKFVETAGKLAKAGFTSTVTSVDVLTTAMNAYGEEAGTADEIANKLVRTQNLGKTTVDQLASSMGKIIPTASGMNVNIDNLTAGYVSLTKQGIATAEATTYMNSMLNELGDSGTDVGGILKEKTGKSFQDLMSEGYSLADVLQITKDYADENGTAYNELWGSAEAGKSALALLNGGVEEFNGTVEIMGSKTDDVGEALDKLNTPSMKIKKSLNQVKNSGVELGTAFMTALLPTLDKIAGVVEKATTWFSSLDERTKTMIATAMLAVAGLSPVLMIGGKIIKGIGTFITYIPTIQGGLSMLSGGFKALWGVMSANPIGAVIAIITALVAGFIYLWNTNEDFRKFVIKTWNTIKTTFTKVVNNIKTTVKNGFDSVKSTITSVMNSVKSTISRIWNNIKSTVSSSVNNIKSKITSGFNTAKSKVSSAINGIKSTISTGLNSAKNTVSSILNSIKNKFSSVMNNAKSIVSSAINKIKGFFNFSWSLPSLKLPHISISGSFSLNPPSVPSFGIDWWKKAVNTPYMFTEPTIFDYNPISGTAKGAGEAGDEIMYGHNNLMNDIRTVTSEQYMTITDAINNGFRKLFEILSQYLPELANMQMYLDSGVLVGATAGQMDQALGKIRTRKERR